MDQVELGMWTQERLCSLNVESFLMEMRESRRFLTIMCELRSLGHREWYHSEVIEINGTSVRGRHMG